MAYEFKNLNFMGQCFGCVARLVKWVGVPPPPPPICVRRRKWVPGGRESGGTLLLLLVSPLPGNKAAPASPQGNEINTEGPMGRSREKHGKKQFMEEKLEKWRQPFKTLERGRDLYHFWGKY